MAGCVLTLPGVRRNLLDCVIDAGLGLMGYQDVTFTCYLEEFFPQTLQTVNLKYESTLSAYVVRHF
jgi:hypothetical protein